MINSPVMSDLLLQWLSTRSHPRREFGKNVIERILNSNGAGKAGFWRHFYPLLRQGHVEQIQTKRYRICSPVLRWQENASRALWLGARMDAAWPLFAEAAENAHREEGYREYPQRWLTYGDRERCRQAAKGLGLGFSEKSVLPFLRRLPDLSTWLKDLPGQSPGVRYRESDRMNLENPGVIKIEHAGVTLSHWVVLEKRGQPRLLDSDDAIQTARWFMRCRDRHAVVRYDDIHKKLFVPVWRDCPMPPLVERLVALETGGPEADADFHFSHVTHELAQEILRILNG